MLVEANRLSLSHGGGRIERSLQARSSVAPYPKRLHRLERQDCSMIQSKVMYTSSSPFPAHGSMRSLMILVLKLMHAI